MITSQDNLKLKEVRRLGRRAGREKLGLFTAEGEDIVLAALEAGWVARSVFVPGSEPSPMPEVLRPIPVEDQLLAEHSQLGSSTRALGVYKQQWKVPAGPLSVALWGVRDPGNVGTVLRGADAFGASGVVLGPRCADPYSPKAVRASMGAIFTVPVSRVQEPSELIGTTVALVADRGQPMHEVLPELVAQGGPITLVVGSEREGLPEPVANACDLRVTIPMARDSVNAAMAATVALYEIARAGHVSPATPSSTSDDTGSAS
ncbi:MAG: RNA methyltransferase [Solirubrobacteraceae bacterium]|nr:RNA methyltransferase [Solirubrobacteraceae bacterium]